MAASATLGRSLGILSMRKKPKRYPLIWAGNILAVLLLFGIAVAAITSPGFRWNIVAKYLFEERVLTGAGMSIAMTMITMALAMTFGVVVALMGMSTSKVLAAVAAAYIWVFRSIPMLVMLLFCYNLAALFPELSLGIPWGSQLFSIDTNDAINPISAAVIALTVHETAYVAELVRSGLIAVPRGQREAAQALGLNPLNTFFRIVLPQAMRIIVPPLGNEVISLLKATSLVSVIALTDLLYAVQLIYAKNYETIPLLIVASIWYMVIVGVLSVAQRAVERRLGRRSLAKPIKFKQIAREV